MRRLLAALPAAVLSLAAAAPFFAAAQAETLVLYTSQPNTDAQQTVDAFKAANPGIDVEWIREGTTKVMTKLEAEFEAGNPAPDVLLIADTVTMQKLKQEGRLLNYRSAEAEQFDPQLYDPEGAFYSTKMITTGIMYNTGAGMRPASWRDLARPEAENLVTMPSPLTSGAALIHVAALVNLEGFGWDYFRVLAGNGAQAAGGNGGVFKAVASGEKAYGIVVDYLPIREKAKGAPVEFVFPEEGVSAVTEPVAILKTAQHPEAAKKFVDFLLSRKGQELVRSQGYIPGRKDIPLPAGYPSREAIRLIPLDPALALENGEAYKKEFAAIFGADN